MLVAGFAGMRTVALLFVAALFATVGCAAAAEDDGSITNDANELNEGRGTLERALDPPLDAPRSEHIGASITDVLAKAKGGAVALAPKEVSEGCKRIDFKDATKKRVVAQFEQCVGSEIVRTLAEDGTLLEEHSDLNKDGKIDRFASPDAAVVTYGDTNYDGEIDLVIERVDRVDDWSMRDYEESFPKSKFLHRVREDRDNDGKLDHERLTAKGALPARS